jgi:hypothetical protein
MGTGGACPDDAGAVVESIRDENLSGWVMWPGELSRLPDPDHRSTAPGFARRLLGS